MNDEVNQIVTEIIQLRIQYHAEVGEGLRRAWPKSIRERIMELCTLGIARKEIAELTGIPYETISQWRHYQMKMQRRKFHTLEVGPRNATVTVAEKSPSTATVTVTTPSGYRIEGSSEDILKILQGISL